MSELKELKQTLLSRIDALIAEGKSKEEAIQKVLDEEYSKLNQEVESFKENVKLDTE